MNVYLLYDHYDLVGIYASPEAAEPDAERCRRSSIWAVGHANLVEIVECQVKE